MLWPQYLHEADEGAGFLSLGPLAILHEVKGLAHLYSIARWTFIYIKDRKMGHFWRRWTAFGTYRNDRKRLDLHYRWSFLKGRGTKIFSMTFFLESSEEISTDWPICHDSSNQTKAFEAYSPLPAFLSLSTLLFPIFIKISSYFFLA